MMPSSRTGQLGPAPSLVSLEGLLETSLGAGQLYSDLELGRQAGRQLEETSMPSQLHPTTSSCPEEDWQLLTGPGTATSTREATPPPCPALLQRPLREPEEDAANLAAQDARASLLQRYWQLKRQVAPCSDAPSSAAPPAGSTKAVLPAQRLQKQEQGGAAWPLAEGTAQRPAAGRLVQLPHGLGRRWSAPSLALASGQVAATPCEAPNQPWSAPIRQLPAGTGASHVPREMEPNVLRHASLPQPGGQGLLGHRWDLAPAADRSNSYPLPAVHSPVAAHLGSSNCTPAPSPTVVATHPGKLMQPPAPSGSVSQDSEKGLAAGGVEPKAKRPREEAQEPAAPKCWQQDYTELLVKQNQDLLLEVKRLRRCLRQWATQGFVTPDQALEFLTSAPGAS